MHLFFTFIFIVYSLLHSIEEWEQKRRNSRGYVSFALTHQFTLYPSVTFSDTIPKGSFVYWTDGHDFLPTYYHVIFDL